MKNERQYFMLKKSNLALLGVGYFDGVGGVWYPDESPEPYKDILALMGATGASAFELTPILEIDEELIKSDYGVRGATRAEGLMHFILRLADDYVPKHTILHTMRLYLTKVSEASFYSTMHKLRKKMPHNESIEMKRGKGYKLVVE